MRAEELMINDWIAIAEPDRYAGATGQIKSLSYHQESDATYFFVFIQGKFGCLLKEVCSDDIRPIPLTVDILKRNGFKPSCYTRRYEYREYKEAGCDKCDVWFDEGMNPGLIQVVRLDENFTVEKVNIRSPFVHQLQHALILCGIKKKIITI